MLFPRLAALVVVASALVTAAAPGAHAQDARVRPVVELFTSQGCSSCPPADRILSDLARDPGVIALSLSIDYWDYLGWRDTLANPAHSARQKGYAKMRCDRQVYTPQMVVNGVTQVPGSDRDAIDRAVAEARKVPMVAVAARIEGDRLIVRLPAGEAFGGADVWLCPVSTSVPVEVSRGENKGHTLTYANVVRGWTRIGTWTGQPASFSVPAPLPGPETGDALAILVQIGQDKPARILGAIFLTR
jgi:hypothetical protein